MCQPAVIGFQLAHSPNLPCPYSDWPQGRLDTYCYPLGSYKALTLPKFQSVPFYPSRVAVGEEDSRCDLYRTWV